jgi:hypothetical protein
VVIMTTAAQEAFLREFHARHPAVTSGAMGHGRAPDAYPLENWREPLAVSRSGHARGKHLLIP